MKESGLVDWRREVYRGAAIAGAILLALALVALAPVPGSSGATASAAPKARVHPPIGEAADCLSCHEAATPQVAQDWLNGKHGLNNVKCYTCHSVPGEKEFTAAPGPERCQACHDAKLTAFQKAARAKGGPKSCSSCHVDHGLKFHSN